MIRTDGVAIYRHTDPRMAHMVIVAAEGDVWVVRLRPGGWALRTQYLGRLVNLRPADAALIAQAHTRAGVPERRAAA